MRVIPLNKGSLELPTDWTELNKNCQRAGWEMLLRVMSGEMEPFVWQVNMLRLITGYTPKHPTENILENLRRLAELLTFAFQVEEDNKVVLNYEMHDCPVQLFGNKGIQPYFIRDRIVSTNLTAGMYADGLQLLEMLNDESNTEDDRLYYLTKLAQVLWRMEMNARAPEPTPGELLAVTVWFTGVVLFFQEHDVYSVLFDAKKANDKPDDYISLGVQEIILEIASNGRPDARDMNLLEFFDAQIKLLKDRIADAKSDGADTSDIIKKTGLPLNTILRLS